MRQATRQIGRAGQRTLLLAAWAVAPQPGWAQLPGVGPSDARVAVDAGQAPWRAVGRVQTELGGRCTGFLIAPRIVLTAAHCLYQRRTGRYVQPGSVHFLLGYDRGRYAAHARVTAYRVGPGYDPLRQGATAGADWAALTLDAAVGTPDRLLALDPSLPSPGTALQLGGYGKDRAEVIDADLHCAATALVQDPQGHPLIRHGCSGTSGTSGAPLLARTAAGGWAAIGIHIAATPGQATGLAVATAALPRP